MENKGEKDFSNYSNAKDLGENTIPLLPRDGQYKALLLDIEGCTTAISFVFDVLFPYARNQLGSYLEESNIKPGTEAYTTLAQSLSKDVDTALVGGMMKEETEQQQQEVVDKNNVESMVAFLMDNDCKTVGLKALQGKMWEAGYKEGKLKGHVYSDLKPMLQWMKKYNTPVYIISSGSIYAQKLLFGHSDDGDLCPYLTNHFDITTAGPKKVATSYGTIGKTLGLDPKSIVFCSDSVAELTAAREAGIEQTIMTIRPGNAPLTDADKEKFVSIYSLLQLCGSD